jgi:hypothetical protein
MRLKERQQDKLGAYSNSVGGGATFYFKKSEWDHVFSEIQEYINKVIRENSCYVLSMDFNWYSNGATFYWWRKLTNEEKDEVKRLNKIENASQKKKEKALAVKLAKKYKLIK